jgi:hypothetical protein
MSVVYNPAIGTATGFDTAQPYGPIVPESDFPDTPQITSLRQKYVQLSTYYSAPTINTTTLYGGVTFYLTNDDGFQDFGGGCVLWQREFARIPSQRQIWSAIDYQFPAVSGSQTKNGNDNVISFSGPSSGNNSMVVQVSNAIYSIGQPLCLEWNYSGGTASQFGFVVTSYFNTGSAIYLGIYPSSPSFIAATSSNRVVYTVTSSSGRLQPTNLSTRAKITFDYFLPGVSAGITLASDITIYQRFKVVDSVGIEIQQVFSASTPTTASWNAWVAAPTTNLQEARDSTFQLWKGQIYERQRVQFVPL